MRLLRLIPTLLIALTAALPAVGQQAWWGLWNTAFGLAERTLLYEGQNELSIHLTPMNSPFAVGAAAHGLRFWISDKTAVREARVWISASYPKEGTAPTIMQMDIPVGQLRDMAHDQLPTVVTFDEAYGLMATAMMATANPYASVSIGVTLQLAPTPLTYLLSSPGKGAALSLFYNGTDVSANYGSLPLQVLISGPQLLERAAEALPMAEQTAVAGGQATLNLSVRNSGAEPLRSVGYQVSIDGVAQAERSYDLPKAVDELGLVSSIPVEYAVPADATEHALSVAVTKVNGQEPTALSEVQTANLVALTHKPLKRTVMEEFTGTWCHNCIRGIAGIHLLEQQFGDRFIAIAMHSDDPEYDRDAMVVWHYRNSAFYKHALQQVGGGIPSCAIDRYIYADPYHGYQTTGSFLTDQLVSEALSRTATADISLTATWADAQLTAIDYDVETTFAYSADDSHYSLVLLLTADGLKGEGRRWRQNNGYNDYSGTEPALLEYAGRGDYLTDVAFDHVAIDVIGVDNGISGSIAKPSADRPQHFSYRLSTVGNALIQALDRLNAIAMLIDTRDGSVVNAAKANVLPYGTLDISDLNKKPTADDRYYDLTGRRLAAPPQKGIYIINGKKAGR